MRSEDRARKTQQPKKDSTSSRKGRVSTKAAQKRHERNISKAQARRDAAIRGRDSVANLHANNAQDKIDRKQATRRRQAERTPAHRAEATAAGREHRKPRFR
jgi:hypothetical protein